jgi:hypothetical protein
LEPEQLKQGGRLASAPLQEPAGLQQACPPSLRDNLGELSAMRRTTAMLLRRMLRLELQMQAQLEGQGEEAYLNALAPPPAAVEAGQQQLANQGDGSLPPWLGAPAAADAAAPPKSEGHLEQVGSAGRQRLSWPKS